MKFIEIPTIDSEKNECVATVNPEHIVMLIKFPIPTGMTGPDGKTPIVKPGTGICLTNGNVFPCSMTKQETRKFLEENA